jgi:hypothetical protein
LDLRRSDTTITIYKHVVCANAIWIINCIVYAAQTNKEQPNKLKEPARLL